MSFVLDATVALAWCFEDEGGSYAVEVLEALSDRNAVVSSVWPFEVCNGLVSAEQRHRLKVADTLEASELLQSLPLRVDTLPPARVFDTVQRLARTHRISSYDAAALELGIRLALPVATLSPALRKAVEAEGLLLYRSPVTTPH